MALLWLYYGFAMALLWLSRISKIGIEKDIYKNFMLIT
jgi:hypothetical protein